MGFRGRLEGLVPAARRWERPSVVKLQRDAAIGRLAELEKQLLSDQYAAGYCLYEEGRRLEDQAARDWLARFGVPEGVDTQVDIWRAITARNEAEDATNG